MSRSTGPQDPRPRVLWVTPYVPARGYHAGGNRMVEIIVRLLPEFEISVLTLLGPPLGQEQGARAIRTLESMGVEVRSVPFDAPYRPHLGTPSPSAFKSLESYEMRRALGDTLRAREWDLVQLEYTPSFQWLEGKPDCPVVLTIHQLEFMAAARRALNAPTAGVAAINMVDSLKALSIEKKCMATSQAVVALTPQEAHLVKLVSARPCLVAPMGAPPCTPKRSKPRFDFFFHGNYTNEANHDAARVLLTRFLPAVRTSKPDATAALAGPFMDLRLKRAAIDSGVTVLDRVEDLDEALSGARLFVAPLRLGGGMRGKLLDALAAGLPVVTTRLGAQGLEQAFGLSPPPVVALESPEEMADAALKLVYEPKLLESMSESCRRLASRYTWERAAGVYASIYRSLLENEITGT